MNGRERERDTDEQRDPNNNEIDKVSVCVQLFNTCKMLTFISVLLIACAWGKAICLSFLF